MDLDQWFLNLWIPNHFLIMLHLSISKILISLLKKWTFDAEEGYWLLFFDVY